MDKYERYKDVPHFDLIEQDKTITIFSIFQFTGGAIELFPFLKACEEYNCAVLFENEEIFIKPNYPIEDNIRLSIYASIAENPKIANDYIRYLTAKSFSPEKLEFKQQSNNHS